VTTALPAARLGEFWKALADPLRARREEPLPRRLVETAAAWSGASRAILYMRDKDAWVKAACSDEQDGPPLPDPIPTTATSAGAVFWVPLESEGEVHGHLGLEGISPDDTEELALSVGFLLGALIAAHRLSRLVKEAEFEVKTRLLELESLYDLGLSLGGQLDLAALGDEVLYRSISLTDAGKGTLVLFDDGGKLLFERSLGGDLLPADRFASWRLPEGEAVINNAAAALPTAGERLSSCQKCLAVAISVLGRRLGVLAVADKESREGGVLDFTPTDARLLSLFANQAAAAIETARLHKEAIEKERIERELELAAAIQREILPR
jgi:sigma-B regulation protein RsbU (phosphoserine phosphatase)